MTQYTTKGQPDCADCEWLAKETDGEILICDECAHDLREEEKNND